MPKGVLETQRQSLHILASGMYPVARMALRSGAPVDDILALVSSPKPDACALLSIPLFHVQGCLNWFIGAIGDGSRLTFLRRWSVPDAVRLMVAEKVTKIGGVPTIATSVLQSPLLPKDFVLQASTFGGAAPPARLPGDLNKRWPGMVMATGWGMTETNSTTTGFCGFEYLAKVSPSAV
jgi:acyl-CoA synthetase (AMP-forming)/AMP-acid ligase II